jgi:hypothetical protein
MKACNLLDVLTVLAQYAQFKDEVQPVAVE